MSIPPTQSQQVGSHRGAGTFQGGRRVGRRTADDAGFNPTSVSMQVEPDGRRRAISQGGTQMTAGRQRSSGPAYLPVRSEILS